MEIINLKIHFPEVKFADLVPDPSREDANDYFPRVSPLVHGFPGPIDEVEFAAPPKQVTALLTGFKVWFQRPDDKELGNLEVRVGLPEQLSDTRYRIPVTFGLRDWSTGGGEWDDEHGADVHVVVIGE